MAKLGTFTLTGQSGQQYQFDAFPWDTEFEATGAVYYVSKRTDAGDHTSIYVGQTGDISERFDNHHKADCFRRHGRNCISGHVDSSETSRLAKEDDLIKALNPPCNG